MWVWTILITSAILTVSLHIELAVVGFTYGGDTLVTVVVVLIMGGGGETQVGVGSAVAVRITGGVGLTTSTRIVVGRTLVGVSKSD